MIKYGCGVKYLMKKTKLLFWDFDGVIKDSIDVKTTAFVRLFEPYGRQVADRVRLHHEANGGMSRFDKIPIYLRWGGEEPTPEKVQEYCDKFSNLVLQSVIDAPWVPGVEEYLRNNSRQQIFVLVSATPQEEIEHILQALHLRGAFASVFGAPVSKKEAIHTALKHYNVSARECLMIGDALADLEAAQDNQVPFLLRRHSTNNKVFEQYTGNSVEDFTKL